MARYPSWPKGADCKSAGERLRGFKSSRQRQLLPPVFARLRDIGQPGRYPSGQRGQTVNLLANAFGGSNPPLPTTCMATAGPAEAAGGNSSAVGRQPSKLGVAGSNPVSRSIFTEPGHLTAKGRQGSTVVDTRAHVAQLAEHALGKGEVSGSIPDMGSSLRMGGSGVAPRASRGA